MNKKIMAPLAVFLTLGALALAVQLANGTISFTGKILAPSADVQTLTVDLGNLKSGQTFSKSIDGTVTISNVGESQVVTVSVSGDLDKLVSCSYSVKEGTTYWIYSKACNQTGTFSLSEGEHILTYIISGKTGYVNEDTDISIVMNVAVNTPQ
jgi:type 1 fimbria pilin